jgi:hypothetical protein
MDSRCIIYMNVIFVKKKNISIYACKCFIIKMATCIRNATHVNENSYNSESLLISLFTGHIC